MNQILIVYNDDFNRDFLYNIFLKLNKYNLIGYKPLPFPNYNQTFEIINKTNYKTIIEGIIILVSKNSDLSFLDEYSFFRGPKIIINQKDDSMTLDSKLQRFKLKIDLFHLTPLNQITYLDQCLIDNIQDKNIALLLPGIFFNYNNSDLSDLKLYINNFIEEICNSISTYSFSENEKECFKIYLLIHYLKEHHISNSFESLKQILHNNYPNDSAALYLLMNLCTEFITINLETNAFVNEDIEFNTSILDFIEANKQQYQTYYYKLLQTFYNIEE